MSDITLSKAVRTNLLSLQNTADLMATTQNRLATGKKVNSALDNPTNFFTASSLNSRASDMNSLLDSMANGIQVLEAADNGISAITKTVESMQSTLRQARQDKSFQTESFDVTSDSVLNIGGGTLAEGIQVSLPEPGEGSKATLTSAATFAGPTAAAFADADSETDSALGGAGARAVISFDAIATDLDNKSITVDSTEVTFGDVADLDDAVSALQTQLGENYKVGKDTDSNAIVIEDATATGTDSTAPVVNLGDTAATKATSTFTYDPARMGTGSIEVDGTTYTVDGASAEDFAASLGEQLGEEWVVSNEGNEITIEAAEAGNVTAAAVTLPAATTSSTAFTVDLSQDQTFEIEGQTVDFTTTSNAATDATTLEGQIGTALTAAGLTASDYTIAVDDANGNVTITANTAGAATVAPELTNVGDATAYTATAGLDAITADETDGTAGTTQTGAAAVTQSFTVTYGNKQTEVTVGAGAPDDIAASINEQFTAAGIGVEASIGTDGKLSLAATSAENKSLAISGGDSATIFGTNTVDIGENPEAALNSTKTVDQFVELINRDYGTSIRASNDNGRLRIENLSTTDMSVGVDKDGDASVDTTSTIEGNSVRDSLAAQFNELKDQLDKLADDASFNGINLLRGDKLTITFNESGSSSIDIQTKDGDPITAGNLSIDSLSGSDLDSDANIDKLLSTLGTALNELRSQASSFGSNLSSVQNRQDFTKNMINTLETGAANLTLADTNEEAANLLALQTRQQLSSTALSMASQQDQAVLRLF